MWYRCGGIVPLLILSTLLPFTITLAAENDKPERVVPELRAARVNPGSPVIDGDLSDEAWQSPKLDFARGFRQLDPDEGKDATESTLVAVVYDDDAVYVGFWNYDSEPDKIKRQLVRRDRMAEADRVSVRFDAYHDHQTGFCFFVSSSGVLCDRRYFGDVNADDGWDGVWEGAAKIQPWGWSAEFRIPYYCLRFNEKEEHTWGFNATRYISRKSESSSWAFSPSSEGGYVSTFGHLSGLKGIEPASRVEMLPYVVSSFETDKKSTGNPDGRDYYKNLGIDVKYGISSDLTMDATINPDFGQVELDQPVLNLSAFETFFEEKRPFFLEGSDLFSTPFMLFYSRRIGRSPSRGVDESRPHYFIDYPKATTILGAAKITGKLAGKTSIAFVDAVTDEEKAKYVSFLIDTVTKRIVPIDTLKGTVERQANYSVLRLQQDVFTNSNVGILLTHAGQDKRHPAVTGGGDWRLSTKNGVWTFSGQSVFSRVDNQDVGFGFTSCFGKSAGKHFTGQISGTIKDPNLQINRLGYTSRNNVRRGNTWIQYRTQDDWFIFRNTYHNINGYAGWNYAGVNIEKGWNYNFAIDFLNNWELGGGYNDDYDEYDDMETRGAGLWKRPQSRGVWLYLNTDSRKMVSLALNPGFGKGRNGTWWAHYTGIDIRPRSDMEYSIGANVCRGFSQTIWTENRQDSVIFADLDQDELSFQVSGSFMLRRNLSFQLSGQGYITSLAYGNYREYLGNGIYSGPVRPGSDDQNYSALNSTLILRWEYLPGSTFYFVWTRARSETDRKVNDLDISRDLDRMFSAGANNVWLVKASYWWNI